MVGWKTGMMVDNNDQGNKGRIIIVERTKYYIFLSLFEYHHYYLFLQRSFYFLYTNIFSTYIV